jgi:hypothetical protein
MLNLCYQLTDLPLHGNGQISNIFQAKVDQTLVLRLSDPVDKTLRLKQLAIFECIKSVFGKHEIEQFQTYAAISKI